MRFHVSQNEGVFCNLLADNGGRREIWSRSCRDASMVELGEVQANSRTIHSKRCFYFFLDTSIWRSGEPHYPENALYSPKEWVNLCAVPGSFKRASRDSNFCLSIPEREPPRHPLGDPVSFSSSTKTLIFCFLKKLLEKWESETVKLNSGFSVLVSAQALVNSK